MRELVIDVSHWNGDIDIKSWKHNRGCWGVVVKAGGFETHLGRYRDSRFEENYNKTVACGLHVGAYYYSVSTTVASAKKDAEHFIQLLKGHSFDLPVYYDVEDKRQFVLSKRTLTDVIKAFVDTLNANGYYGGVYTGGSAWLNNVNRDELLPYADWIAAWRATWPDYAGDIGMWQQGGMRLSDGHVVYADVSGYTDLDWCVVDYPARITSERRNNTEPQGESRELEPARGTVECLMSLAYDDLGYYAPSDPEPGSKAGRYCAKLMGEDWLAGPSVSIWWCCLWTSMIMDMAGVTCPGFPSQNTDVALGNGARSRLVSKDEIRRGDLLIFDWNFETTSTDHIGFATGSPRNGYVSTIEGNVGNAVKEKVRALSTIRYVVRPEYKGSSPSTATGATTIRNPTENGKRLDVDGIGGYNTVYEWQSQLGVGEVGKITEQVRSLHEWYEGIVSVDFGGKFQAEGSDTVRAIQAKVGADIDGVWGKETSTKVQQWLEDRGYSVGICGMDGRFGHDSVCALQRSINDGRW